MSNREKANSYLSKYGLMGLTPMFEFKFSSDPNDQTTVILIKYNHEFNRSKTTITIPDIPDFVTEIGDGAFNKCTELEKLILKNPEIKIGKFAFAGCAKLSEIHIGGKITDWHTQSAKMQLSEGTFAGCKNLNITNLPPFAGCFERFHLKGLTCYAQVKQTGEEIKLPDINYTLDPSTMESILLYLLYLMLTNDKSSFLTIDKTSPQPELFLEFDNSQNSSEIILKRFKPETQRRKQFKPFNLSELSSEEKEKILDIYSRIKCVSIDKNNSKEEDPEEILKEILIRLNKNLQDIETGIQETLKKNTRYFKNK